MFQQKQKNKSSAGSDGCDVKTQIHFENLKMFLHLWFVPLLVELLSRGYYTWMGDCRCGQINHITNTKVNSAFYPLVA